METRSNALQTRTNMGAFNTLLFVVVGMLCTSCFRPVLFKHRLKQNEKELRAVALKIKEYPDLSDGEFANVISRSDSLLVYKKMKIYLVRVVEDFYEPLGVDSVVLFSTGGWSVFHPVYHSYIVLDQIPDSTLAKEKMLIQKYKFVRPKILLSKSYGVDW